MLGVCEDSEWTAFRQVIGSPEWTGDPRFGTLRDRKDNEDELDKLVEVDVMGSYACRTRNNRPGARLSEHGLGRAIDIGGFRLADGRRISVKEDWGGSGEGKFLKALHRQSCGLFMTVLGPGADRYHHDHFHLDTARRNGSTYCR